MNRVQLVCVLLSVYSFQPIITLPNGAPEKICHSLLPYHEGGALQPASSRSPFQIVPQNLAVNQGQMLRIEIEPQIPEMTFGGFMIHARNINPPFQVVSYFVINLSIRIMVASFILNGCFRLDDSHRCH